jgi:hypothetical protein
LFDFRFGMMYNESRIKQNMTHLQITDCTDLVQEELRETLEKMPLSTVEDIASNLCRAYCTACKVARVMDRPKTKEQ